MKSVIDKIRTRRSAVAECVLAASASSIALLKANELPKKDVLQIARAAGVLAAKQTPHLIPYCHPIAIDHVEIEFEVLQDRLRISARVEAVWKTGVEMEALTAASVAALTIYDMLKPVEKNLEILSTKLVLKRGGKTDFQEKVPADFKAAILVTSDGTFAGKRQDRSGQLICQTLESFGVPSSYKILPDDQEQIQDYLKELCAQKVPLILTTGGTGLGPRDVTVEATAQIIERQVPGIMEAARAFGQERTPYAMLSRGLAGQRENSLIVNLPGSSNGTRESLTAIFPYILHAYKMMDGLGH